MKPIFTLVLPAILLTLPMLAMADDDDEHGHRHHHHKFKKEYWDGPCKVTLKPMKHGGYEEKRKCKGAPEYAVVQPQPVYVQPRPVYVPPPPVIEPGISVHGVVRLP